MLHFQSIATKSGWLIFRQHSCNYPLNTLFRYLYAFFWNILKWNNFCLLKLSIFDHQPGHLSFHLQEYLILTPFCCEESSMLWTHSWYPFFPKKNKNPSKSAMNTDTKTVLPQTWRKKNVLALGAQLFATMNFTIIFKFHKC